MCAAFLPYRVRVYSAGFPIDVVAHHFLRYRGSAQNGNLLPNGKLAVFQPHRFVRELAVRRCAARTDFLPYRIVEKPAQTDVLSSEPAQRYCAAEQIPFAYFVLDSCSDGSVSLRCRRVVPCFGVWQMEM